MLIVGCDIGSETHYVRAIDTRGRELSRKALAFENNAEGFGKAKGWAVELAAKHGKKQIVLGLEPTGHYWFAIASWMVSQEISVVQVNPYAVKQTKEVEDNSQRKDDRKDPKLIANLVKDGNYGMPYLPEGIYADLRGFALFRDQLTEDRIRCMNRLHRELKIYFPEYKEAYGKVDGAFSLALLKEAPFPKDILKLGTAGIREIWHNAKLRGRGYAKAEELVRYAEESIGLKEGAEENREPVKWYAEEITRLTEKLSEIEEKLHQKCMEIPHTENVLEIPGIGENIMGGILSELGDISRFDDAKELQKLSGLGLVACSSGKHTGETRISRRGRKRLRYWLFQGARSAVAHGLVWNMIDKRVKATMSKVQEEIAPFVKKHVFSRDTVDAKYIRQIAVLFLHQYNNVSICQGLERKDGKPWLKITVKTFPFSEDKILEVTGIPKEKKNNNLDWIDHIEECEAFMDD